MKLYLKTNEDKSPLSRLTYVEDDSDTLTGIEIAKFVAAIIQFAPATYSKEDVKMYLMAALDEVYV